MTSIIKSIKKVVLALLILQIIFAIGNVSHAGFWEDILSAGDSFLSSGKEAVNKGSITTEQGEDGSTVTISMPETTDIKEIINNIYNIIFPLGVAITVIIGGVLGIKFMMASVEEKAKIKESLIPYVAGCIVIYGAFGIWKIVITIFSTIG